MPGAPAPSTGTVSIGVYPAYDPPPDFDQYDPPVYRYFMFDILTDQFLAEIEMSNVTFSHKLVAVGNFSGTVGGVNSQPDIDM
jgi:hypothetical protein